MMNDIIDVNLATFASTPAGLNIDNFVQIFSPYLVAFLSAYVLTEIIKIAILSFKRRELRWRDAFKSGGMPSSHSAEVTALATVVGLIDGFGSALFGVVACFAAIVVFDAFHVRRAVGEQGEALRKLIDRDFKQEGAISDISRETGAGDDKTRRKLRKPYLARGHKPAEVFVGCALGVLLGFMVYLAMAS